MYDHTYYQMKENWMKIIDFGPHPFGSQKLKECSNFLLEEMSKITETSFQDVNDVPAWEVESWELEVTEPVNRKLQSYVFLGSGASEGFEGRVKYAGHHRIWNMYVWHRYMVVDDTNEIQAYITVRDNGEAIPQMLFTGESELPHFIVGEDEGEFFHEAYQNKVIVKGYARTKKLPYAKCYNIVGMTKHIDKKVVICAHYDTVYSTPGAYDNSAGAAVLLEIGRRLRKYEKLVEIELLLTDGEEYNLVGARQRCQKCEDENIIFVLNIDGVGRDEVLEVWSGPEPFERTIRGCLENSREKFDAMYKCPPPPGSDHAPYFEKGIPVCMLTFNDQGILHSPKDVYEESKLDNMAVMVRLSLELLTQLHVVKTTDRNE